MTRAKTTAAEVDSLRNEIERLNAVLADRDRHRNELAADRNTWREAYESEKRKRQDADGEAHELRELIKSASVGGEYWRGVAYGLDPTKAERAEQAKAGSRRSMSQAFETMYRTRA